MIDNSWFEFRHLINLQLFLSINIFNARFFIILLGNLSERELSI